MILKDLLLITFGGGGFLGLMGTSGYFVYRQETIKSVERDISKTLGEINKEVQNLIGKKVGDDGKITDVDASQTVKPEQKSQKITEIKNLIQKAQEKNNTSWKHYVDGVSGILTRYTKIVDDEKQDKYRNTIKNVKLPARKPVVPKPAAARPVATKTEATKTEASKPAAVRPPVVAKPVA